MVGRAGVNGSRAVELLEEDDQGEFVLEGEAAQGPAPIGALAEFVGVTVGAADEESDGFGAAEFPGSEPRGELAGGDLVTAFVEDDPEHALATLDQGAAFLLATAGFEFRD